jgi:hypothetical protein
VGIRTTLPFFRWLLEQPAFHDGDFHTGYLDELLQQRAGEPFSGPDLSLEEVAAVAAALYVSRRSAFAADRRFGETAPSLWKERGRAEGLRG